MLAIWDLSGYRFFQKIIGSRDDHAKFYDRFHVWKIFTTIFALSSLPSPPSQYMKDQQAAAAGNLAGGTGATWYMQFLFADLSTPWVKKTKTPNSCSYLCQKIDRFFKFFRCYSQQEICNKKVITDPITHKRCRYTTLRNISLQKLYWPKAQQRQTRRAHTGENVTAVEERR